MDHPQRSKYLSVGNPIKLLDSPTGMKRSPLLGEHTDEILKDVLKYDDARIAALAGSGATEAQVRSVFRLEREFQDRFALVFDLTPGALLERQRVRDEYDGKIVALLDPMDALAWLTARDGDQGLMNDWVRQRGLPPAAALELWRIKSDFVVRRLELKSAKSVPPTALGDLIRETQVRLSAAAGADTLAKERDGIFRWLPRP